MKQLLAAAAAVLALPLLTACAGSSRAGEAGDLRDALAELPGVGQVELDYTQPVVLDSGKLELRVRMAADADRRSVVAVATRAYEGFSGPHDGEEGDLFVTTGDDTVHLRSFSPQATVDAVTRAAEHAISVLPAGAVRADITTQDVEESPHVFTEYTVTIGEKDGDSVRRTLTDLEHDHADIPAAGWSVQTHEDEVGWRLGSSAGFPTSRHRALFDELRRDLPRGATILMDEEFVTATVPADTTPDTVAAIASRHLAALGGAKRAFYDVMSGEGFAMMISAGECVFASDQLGDRLEQDHGADCTKVSRE